MQYYEDEIKKIFDEIVSNGFETRAEILGRWEEGDTGDDFGNLTGSRFCSAYKAEQALKAANFPWDSDLRDLLEDVGYNIGELLERGPEVIDVILCELMAPFVAAELRA